MITEQLVALASDSARKENGCGCGMADASLVYVQRVEGSRDKFRSAQILEVRSTAVDARCSLSLIDAWLRRARADVTGRRQN
eukprot:COSAG02_NODE_4566_length_5212_cov_3.031293_5_plen_82_part_00